MSSKEFKQVFLSHCVRSSGTLASQLNQLLQRSGLTTFTCVDMELGERSRKSIQGNATNCKVMVVFMDEDWTQSGECELEFNDAISIYNKEKSPVFLPIVVGGFGWIKPKEHHLAHCLTSSFQCIPLHTS